jgi:hypothetical protein
VISFYLLFDTLKYQVAVIPALGVAVGVIVMA